MPSRITTIPLSRILPAPQHVRSSFDKASIAALAESIRRFGLLSPLLVRRRSAGEYELIAGARRLQALKSLGCREAEAIVLIAYDGDCTLISLIENIQREELHFLDEARACRRLLENGTVVSGKRFDEILSLDRIAADLQEAALELLTSGTGKLPQTDETSAVFINRFSAVLSEYTARGILATGIWRGQAVGSLEYGDTIGNGYLLWADSYDRQSDADRAAHRAMPIHAALCLSGSVETLLIDVDVSI